MSSVYEFGPFRLDPAERLLLREGTPVSLAPKAFDVLVLLVTRHGHLVTKQDLLDVVWAGTFVEETNLAYTVSALRKALGDGQKGERYVQTVPTKGYRFVGAIIVGPEVPPVPTPHQADRFGPRAMALVAVATLVLALVAGLAMMRGREASPVAGAAARFTITLPDTPLAANWIHPVSISPNGTTLAVLLGVPRSLWLRPLHTTAAEPVPGAEGAVAMAWAPDSRSLAVGTQSAVKMLRIGDKSWRTICDGCQVQGTGAWTVRGPIVFTGADGSLVAVSEGGGPPSSVTRLDMANGELAHVVPQELPDGRLLFWVSNPTGEGRGFHVVDIAVADDGVTVARLNGVLREMDSPGLAVDGYLVYSQGGEIKARPFDTSTLSITGPPATLVDRERFSRGWFGGGPSFAVSKTGILVYSLVEHPKSQFHWFDRAGKPLGSVADPDWYFTLDLSPDERSLATARMEDGRADVWSFDLVRGGWTRRTFGAAGQYADPRWMPDGEGLVVMAWPLPPEPIHVEQVGAENLTQVTGVPDRCVLDDVSRDGQYLLCRPRPTLMAVPLLAQGEGRVIYTPPTGVIDQPEMSPDSKWVAFNGDDSGRMEVYVVPVQQTGPRRIVSVDGGVQPRWRADGRELFYLGLDGTLFVVSVATRPDGRLELSRPAPLFTSGLVAPSQEVEQYAVSNDGQRFLMLLPLENRIRRSVGVLQNWPALVRAVTAAAP
jgi:DNA-binding winged helix-turn-helix (wHTH) protein